MLPIVSFSLDSIFAESANALIDDEKYNEALQILKTIIIQEKATNKKILPMIEKGRCEIERHSYSDAETTFQEIEKLTESKAFENENNETKKKCHSELDLLVKRLIEIEQINLALLLVENQLNLIKHSFSALEKLSKLKNLGISLKDMSKILHYKNDSKIVKELYSLFDKVLNGLQSLDDIDLRIKTRHIGWFMMYYGTSCNYLQDFNKAIVVFPKLIFLMKTVFGDKAADFLVYGMCHHNYANALKETNRLIEAKEMFEETLKIYEQVSNWPNEKQKTDKSVLTIKVLDDVNFKLDSSKKKLFFKLIHYK